MTGRLVLSPRAQRDLEKIWDDTQERWGIDQAERYTRQIWENIRSLAARPSLGRACPELRAGYYKYRSGVHIVFYRLTDSGIDIVRILHERMDLERHL
jgi:toxin ParE1/3/4